MPNPPTARLYQSVLQRASLWTSVLLFGGALVATLLAILSLGGIVRLNPAWTLVAAGAVTAAVGTYLLQWTDQVRRSLEHNHQALELAQVQLAAQRAQVDTLADGLDVAVFLCDPKGSVQYANRRAMEMFQFVTPKGRSVLAVTLSHELERLVNEAVESGGPVDSEIVFTFPTEGVGLAKAWCQTDRQRVFLSLYEITELRRLERIRTDFVANVSHELRTPLTIIRAYAETIHDDDDPVPSPDSRRRLEKIIAEVDRLSTISQDLLILSAAESNPVRKMDCDVAAVFQAVASQLEPLALKKGLLLIYAGPERCLIEANANQVTQVAINLVSNAINYTNEGRIEVNLQAGDPVEIQVRDTGIGLSRENQARIFERFYRVDKGRSRGTGGTGLGLSIVKHIVEAHGGSVSVRSELGQGSVFTVRLPVGNLGQADAAS